VGAAGPNRTSGHLSVVDHDRGFAGLKYVYPVVSRRAGGVSIGVNLNPNNACNWRCVYCQVPNLGRGSAPAVDFAQLERELRQLLDAVCRGSYLEEHAPPEARTLKDIAISGNGEPTSCPDFAEVVECIGRLREHYGIARSVGLVLITNGSLVTKPQVQRGLRLLSSYGGEIWFKLDRGADAELHSTNGSRTSVARQLQRLGIAAGLCRTLVQSCWYTQSGADPLPAVVDAYVACLAQALQKGVPVAAVQLYTLARKPQLPEGADLGAVSSNWIAKLAARLKQLGLRVVVTGQ
jgi:hypothetical protein